MNRQDLSFDALRLANVDRCRMTWHHEADWTLTDWATAAAGELGEACGVVKDMRRLSADPDHDSPYRGHLVQCLGDEIADTVLYLDLLAARAGIDLSEAIRRKFNRTSDEAGSAVRL